MWCFGLCLLNSFLILLKGTPAWEAGGVATAEDTFDWGSKLNTFSASTNVQRHLKGQRILILKDDLLLKKKKKKRSRTKSSKWQRQKVYPENNTLPWSGASFMAIYPGLYIALLNSCYDNSVNRIQVTTEGFSSIVSFREKNGSFNASFTEIP